MAKKYDEHFVDNGCERARAAAMPTIRAEIEREYAERLNTAGWFERWRLRREIRREIEKRLDRVAPPSGIYIADKH